METCQTGKGELVQDGSAIVSINCNYQLYLNIVTCNTETSVAGFEKFTSLKYEALNCIPCCANIGCAWSAPTPMNQHVGPEPSAEVIGTIAFRIPRIRQAVSF